MIFDGLLSAQIATQALLEQERITMTLAAQSAILPSLGCQDAQFAQLSAILSQTGCPQNAIATLEQIDPQVEP